MRRRALKKEILQLLRQQHWPKIANSIAQYPPKDLVHHLFTALCSTDEICKWHSISVFGMVVPKLASENLDSARIIMRRFLWSLNDESGGIGWGVPEAMGEVMANDTRLFNEYSHMLISYMREDGPELFQDGNYLELPTLQRGLLWGIGRLIFEKRKEMLKKGVADDIRQYLSSPDTIVRGLAVWCLGMCKDRKVLKNLEKLPGSSSDFTLYWDNKLHGVNIDVLIEQAVRRIMNATDSS